MPVEVQVNGETFRRFKSIGGTRSIDTFASEIGITVSQAANNDSILKADDLIVVFLDGLKRFTGYIEKISDKESRSNHDIEFRARSKVADLIDSTCPENVKSLEGVQKYSELVQLCIDGLGLTDSIKVIDNVGATFGDSEKLKAGATGQKVGDFLQENARIVQVFLNDDGDGNVVITRTAGKYTTIIQNVPGANNNNVKSSNIDIDYSERYYKYVVYSNSSLASDSSTVNDINNKGEAFDTEIRKTRIFEKVAEKPMTADQCKRAAEEEANIRRSRSFNYTCSIAGFSANGELWDSGKEVTVKDPVKGVNGLFLLNSYSWKVDNGGGEVSDMTITMPDKLTVEPDPTPVVERTTETSISYIVKKGDTLSEIAAAQNVSLRNLIAANPKIDNPDLIFPDQQIIIPGE